MEPFPEVAKYLAPRSRGGYSKGDTLRLLNLPQSESHNEENATMIYNKQKEYMYGKEAAPGVLLPTDPRFKAGGSRCMLTHTHVCTLDSILVLMNGRNASYVYANVVSMCVLFVGNKSILSFVQK